MNIKLRFNEFIESQSFKYDVKQICREISYSQSGEDRIIDFYFRALLNLKEINYCEIGANHPYKFSNTALLDEKYYIKKGVLVEPNPELATKLKKRKKAIIESVGICGGKEEISTKELNYYLMDRDTLNTFSYQEVEENIMNGYKNIGVKKVPVIHINNLLKKHFENEIIDVLSVDVEGMDYEIISSIDFDKYKIRLICVETSHNISDEIKYFLTNKNYKLCSITFENSIYVKEF